MSLLLVSLLGLVSIHLLDEKNRESRKLVPVPIPVEVEQPRRR
jgi:hypothetical protein